MNVSTFATVSSDVIYVIIVISLSSPSPLLCCAVHQYMTHVDNLNSSVEEATKIEAQLAYKTVTSIPEISSRFLHFVP